MDFSCSVTQEACTKWETLWPAFGRHTGSAGPRPVVYLGVCQELLIEEALLLGRPGADRLLGRQLGDRVVHARVGVDEQLRRALRGVQQLRGDLCQIQQTCSQDRTICSCVEAPACVALDHAPCASQTSPVACLQTTANPLPWLRTLPQHKRPGKLRQTVLSQ